jgi:hypothetical protein
MADDYEHITNSGRPINILNATPVMGLRKRSCTKKKKLIKFYRSTIKSKQRHTKRSKTPR